MRFGLSFPLTCQLSDVAAVAELAREAEIAGWDGLFVWDHLKLIGTPPLADPWVALALIAHATQRIRFGTLVTPLFRRNPAKLACETVTLDHLSKGRLILGVGLGSDLFGEISAFGGPLDDKLRAAMLDEGLTVLTGLWSGHPFSIEGKYHRLHKAQLVPSCFQSPRIPIWIAGSWLRKAPLRRAARYDGVVPVYGDVAGFLTPSQLRELVAYIKRFRSSADPFDVVRFSPPHDADNRQLIEPLASAGVTWWIETISLDETNDIEQIHQRIRRGPPS
jgi:alkanesulfonate monooxygenase SsuD/methylene tetrahydromethanopterin reductase-like flavin-dependent oxidoreductase (luciferase family)